MDQPEVVTTVGEKQDFVLLWRPSAGQLEFEEDRPFDASTSGPWGAKRHWLF